MVQERIKINVFCAVIYNFPLMCQVGCAVKATAELECDMDPTIVVDLLKREAIVQRFGFHVIVEDLTGAWLATGQ